MATDAFHPGLVISVLCANVWQAEGCLERYKDCAVRALIKKPGKRYEWVVEFPFPDKTVRTPIFAFHV
eukprot:g10903.t1